MHSITLWLGLCILLFEISAAAISQPNASSVTVFYFVTFTLAEHNITTGQRDCSPDLNCSFIVSPTHDFLKNEYKERKMKNDTSMTVALFNIHR